MMGAWALLDSLQIFLVAPCKKQNDNYVILNEYQSLQLFQLLQNRYNNLFHCLNSDDLSSSILPLPVAVTDRQVASLYSSAHAVQFQTSGPLLKVHWLRLVLDEGHTIRNASTQTSKAVFSVKADRKWVVTG